MKKFALLPFLVLFVCFFAGAQNVGVQLYSFRNQFKTDVKGTVETIKKMGITEVEGGDSYGITPEAFKKLLDDNGIKTISVGADFKQLSENPQAIIDNAKFFGAKYIMCAWIPHNAKGFTIEDAKNAVAVFNTAGKLFTENGLTFCYHAHGYEFLPYENGTLFDYLMHNLDPKYVNFEMDVFWVKQPGQDPVALMKKYSGRFKLLHLKDRKIGTPNSLDGRADEESNVVLGTGDVGIAAVMKEAKKQGIKYCFIEDESSHPVEQIPLSLGYLRSLK